MNGLQLTLKNYIMKKTLFLVLFVIASMQSQTVSYVASTENIANPERGFYKWTTGNSTGTFSALDVSELTSYRTNDKITLVLRLYLLDAFKTTPISQDFLIKIKNDFDALRAAGVKCVLRFKYTDVDGTDANKAQIIAHIEQLKPITTIYQDVISSLSSGFIGDYGEWWNSVNFGTYNLTAQNLADRKEIGLKIMELVPLRMMALRTPIFQRLVGGNTPITAQTAYNGSINSRIGAHNDCFLSSSDDVGTYSSPEDYTYLESQSKYTFDGGEVCRLTTYSDCSNAVASMTRFHFSYLSTVYNEDVLNYWKSNGCFDEIQKRLGYRYELLNSTLSNAMLTINLQNVGFATIFNLSKAYLIMKNISNATEYKFILNTDLRLWQAGQQTQLVHNMQLSTVPNGNYKLFLFLPDAPDGVPPTFEPLYSIQCANIGTWEPIKGYNDLKLVYSVANLSTQIFLNSDKINVTNLDKYTLQVFDLTGKLVSTSFDISNLSNSVYIVKVKSDGMLYTQKIVKK